MRSKNKRSNGKKPRYKFRLQFRPRHQKVEGVRLRCIKGSFRRKAGRWPASPFRDRSFAETDFARETFEPDRGAIPPFVLAIAHHDRIPHHGPNDLDVAEFWELSIVAEHTGN